jgi:hypothetical protein
VVNFYPNSVSEAAILLDSEAPGWHNSIDLERLYLPSANKCILGQIYVSTPAMTGYGRGMHILFKIDKDKAHFFQQDQIFGSKASHTDWVNEITKRRLKDQNMKSKIENEDLAYYSAGHGQLLAKTDKGAALLKKFAEENVVLKFKDLAPLDKFKFVNNKLQDIYTGVIFLKLNNEISAVNMKNGDLHEFKGYDTYQVEKIQC